MQTFAKVPRRVGDLHESSEKGRKPLQRSLKGSYTTQGLPKGLRSSLSFIPTEELSADLHKGSGKGWGPSEGSGKDSVLPQIFLKGGDLPTHIQQRKDPVQTFANVTEIVGDLCKGPGKASAFL